MGTNPTTYTYGCSTGAVLVEYAYDPYGNLFSTVYKNGGESIAAVVNNSILYRGYYFDRDLGLYYLISRYYDSNTGRFISPDDVSYLGANGDLNSYNLYAYCSNNPINCVDPTGHSLFCIFVGMAIGALFAFSATVHSDYKDDGEVFNGSVEVVDYVTNTLVGGVIGAAIGYAAPAIASSIASSGATAASLSLAGGEAIAVTVTAEQVAGAAAVAGTIINCVTTGKSNGYWGQKYSNDHKPDHVHLKGPNTNIRIGKDGKPLKGEPSLTSQQRKALKKLWNEFLELFRI